MSTKDISWFNIYNKTTFEAEDLVSKDLLINMDEFGENKVLLTKGNRIGLAFDGNFLYLDDDENPFLFADHLLYLDDANDIWLGILSDAN